MKTAAAFATNALRLDAARKNNAATVAQIGAWQKKEGKVAGISGWLEDRGTK